MAFASLGDVELFYTDEGEGDPPMLFVHGYSCDSHDWMYQLAHFTRSHRVIAVDLRGHGRSSAPAEGYDGKDLASDVAALLERLGVGPVVAIGHSMGAGVVTALAVEHPELVAAVVCVDPSYLLEEEVYARVVTILDALNADPVRIAQGVLSNSYTPASPPQLKAWHMRRIAGVPGHVLYQAMARSGSLTIRSETEPYLRRRNCPVLSIFSHDDRIALERSLFTDARSRAFAWPGSGHWLHQERPAEFNAVVEEWLETIGSG